MTDEEKEIAHLRKSLKEAKLERDILKKAINKIPEVELLIFTWLGTWSNNKRRHFFLEHKTIREFEFRYIEPETISLVIQLKVHFLLQVHYRIIYCFRLFE